MVRPAFPRFHHGSVILGASTDAGGVLRRPEDNADDGIVLIGRTTHALFRRRRRRAAMASPEGRKTPMQGPLGILANTNRRTIFTQQDTERTEHPLLPASAH